MLADYLALVRAHPRPLAFAFFLATLSSFGQTFFIALSGAGMRAEFHASDGALGTAYAVATLLSGLTLGWAGRGIDRVPLRLYAAGVGALLVIACIGAALATGLIAMTIAFFLLRLSGQGLMTHTAMTATVRSFPQDRGKALGLAALGFAAGEALLPPIVVALDAGIGWRGIWWAAAATTLPGMALALMLLPRAPAKTAAPSAPKQAIATRPPGLWRDRRMWRVMPAVLAPSFVVTGFFFHQVRLAEEMGWDLSVVASAFAGFAAMRAWAMLRIGPVIDRVGAAPLLPFFLMPLCLAMGAILAGGLGSGMAVAYLLIAGLTSGVSTTLSTALWAEFFGLERIGAVRAAVAGASVIASALAPAMFGVLLDAGVTLWWQAGGCLILMLGACLLTAPVARAAGNGGNSPASH
jgi:MFS family permease